MSKKKKPTNDSNKHLALRELVKEPQPVMLPIEILTMTAETQSRQSMTAEAITSYAEMYGDPIMWDKLPPIEVRTDGITAWVVDGFHRVLALKQAKEGFATCCLLPCDDKDHAIWFACSSNQAHGIRRTNKDKQRSIVMALSVKPNLSSREIALHCGVSHESVSSLQRQMKAQDKLNASADRPEIELPVAEEDTSSVLWKQKYALDRLCEVIDQIKVLHDVCSSLIKNKEVGAYLNGQSLLNDIKNVQSGVEFALPHKTCPLCEGVGCATCKTLGWITKRHYNLIPASQLGGK